MAKIFGQRPLKAMLGTLICATAVSTTALMGAPAQAATPAAVIAGDTPRATISDDAPEGVFPKWRTYLLGTQAEELWAYSPSMNRNIPLVVLRAKDPGRPTLYLLNGADGGEGPVNWVSKTDALQYYADKNVNVVIPMAGRFSYYLDWQEEAPAFGGVQKWDTFLTKELPEPLERELRADGRRAIAGMSMSATSSLLLAEHNPGLYDAVGSFSGCAETNSAIGHWAALLTTEMRGGQKLEKMFGAIGSPARVYNDALINADKLRGHALYISNGSGLGGPWDLWSSPFTSPQLPVMTHLIDGGLIEAASNICTHNLTAKLDSLQIPADVVYRNNGTHSWGYWQDDLRNSWPTFARAWGLPPEEQDGGRVNPAPAPASLGSSGFESPVGSL